MTANPSGDGIGNLLKYAAGEDPNASITSGDIFATNGVIGGQLIVTYTLSKNALNISVTPEKSTDLSNWSDDDITVTKIAEDADTVTFQASSDLIAGTLFMHLNATHN